MTTLESTLREVAVHAAKLRRLAKSEAQTLANVRARYEQRRASATRELSPAAARLLAAMDAEQKRNGESESEPELPPWTAEEPPEMPAPVVVERKVQR
jgi:hypothetical protein